MTLSAKQKQIIEIIKDSSLLSPESKSNFCNKAIHLNDMQCDALIPYLLKGGEFLKKGLSATLKHKMLENDQDAINQFEQLLKKMDRSVVNQQEVTSSADEQEVISDLEEQIKQL